MYCKELKDKFGWLNELEPDLFHEFITYWSIRKSPTQVANSMIEEITSMDFNNWIKLIESNHKFRTTYGDEVARELISIIESKRTLTRQA